MAKAGLTRRALAALAFAAPFGASSLAAASIAPPPTDAPPVTDAATDGDRYRHITAEVFVNGQGPFTFLVDTGANRSAICETLAARLGLPLGEPVQVNTVIGARERPTVRVAALRIGDHAQSDVDIPTLALGEGTIDGILGVDWLRNRRLTFFFGDRRLVIEPSAVDPLGGAVGRSPILMPAQLRSGQLSLVDAAVGTRRVQAMIDTGAEFTLGNRALQRWAERNLGSDVRSQKVRIRTVTGETAQGDLMLLPRLRLGPALLGGVPVVFADVQVFRLWDMERQPALVLGLDLIGAFDALSLDFGRRLVRLDPPRALALDRGVKKTAVL